ncbi:membrane protein [Novosphingobium marinum]|nr:DUF6691 family protein [Novosphingobium marinum]GGC32450.1 membrane protein [Novosphingobium marinum]
MRTSIVSLVSGTLFGAGLAISGMMNPARVRGFLDFFGSWDPTLAFVMGGAVIIMAVAWAIQSRMRAPVCEDAFALPGTTRLDGRLIGGAVLFGIGWGLSGLCPGPAISSLAVNPLPALVFVTAMLAGMAIFRMTESRGQG